MTDATIHDFRERLEWSSSLSDEGKWIDFYKRIWPSMVCAVRYDRNGWHQKHGIDREVSLQNGRRILVDEKKREKDYGDVLLEIVSVGQYDQTARRMLSCEKPGWAVDQDKHCDFIAYAILPTNRVYLLPFELLRLATTRNFKQWRTGVDSSGRPAYPKVAKNRGYWTANLAVSWSTLRSGLIAEMQKTFDPNQGPLPVPVTFGEQDVFSWGKE